jgi:hypothetical protein
VANSGAGDDRELAIKGWRCCGKLTDDLRFLGGFFGCLDMSGGCRDLDHLGLIYGRGIARLVL